MDAIDREANTMMNAEAREILIQRAEAMWGGFYRCPTTGRIREALPGDDKVCCNCGQSNPKVPTERTHQTGTHLIRFMTTATAEEYITEREARRAV